VKRLIAFHDIENRDRAICIINNEVFEGENHTLMLQKYVPEMSKEDVINFSGQNRDLHLKTENSTALAFAHLSFDDDGSMGIFIDTKSLFNISLGDVVQILKEKYSNAILYDDDSVQRLDDEFEDYKKIANTGFLPMTPLYPLDYFGIREKLKKGD